MKQKIEVGQCYEKDDVIFEVIWISKDKQYCNLKKVMVPGSAYLVDTALLAKMRRPFQNWG
jgi:hypothetical protein